MPIYEYHCDNCNKDFEITQKISENPKKSCPECGSRSFKKLVSATAFQLKGTGWYKTDYAPKPAAQSTETKEPKKEKKEEKKTEKTNDKN